LNRAETIGIVGESGCGKTVTVQSIMKLIPMPPGRIKQGKILFENKNITGYSDKKMQSLRGSEMGMIFQDPMTSLNPTMKIGNQIIDVLKRHKEISTANARKKAIEMLGMVGLPNPQGRINQYPHEFSGGMRQRVMIAIALICGPKLLIADEPTTALDVTIQAQILDLMKDLKKKISTSIILITHDLGVIAGMAERVIVMYAGKIMESGTVDDIFLNPLHPYSWGLLKSVPRLDAVSNEKKLSAIPGYPPDLFSPPVGCPFAARCNCSMEICYEAMPKMTEVSNGHQVACWLTHPLAPKVNRESVEGGKKDD
jgi:oligopeptide transport system ATP-binding protein